jgi:hypothetical protein
MPENGKIALRAAFGMNSCFEIINLFDDEDTIVILLNSKLGEYEVRVNYGKFNELLWTKDKR